MDEWPDELDDLANYLESAIEEVHNAAVAADGLDMDIAQELFRIEQELEGLLVTVLPSDADSL
jgi:hypothetical protein